jgi:type I restriction enzyme S subunit
MEHIFSKTKLSQISHITMGQSPLSESYNESKGLPFFQGNADFGKIYPRIRLYCTQPTKFAKTDDILISVRAPIGAVNISNCECCIGRGLASVRAVEKISINKYLYYLLLSANEKLNRQGTGSTFKAISKDVLHKLECYNYPIDNQYQIVSELDSLSDIITMKKQQLEDLDKLAQATFYNMFGDPVSNEKGWKVKKLGEVCLKITDGKHGDCEDESESGCYFISAKDINVRRINTEKARQITYSDFIETNNRTRLTVNDVVVVNTGATIGKTAIANQEDVIKNLTFQKSVAIITTDSKELNYNFLELYIHLNKNEIYNEASGSAQKNWLLSQMRNYKILLPPLNLQIEFAKLIEKIEKQKELINNSIADVQQLFDYTMDKYFN